MAIANLKRSAVRLQNLDPRVPITKTLISAAIVLGFGVVGAAPASADPDASGTHPNPFSGLSCDCQETVPPDNTALREQEIRRGIQAGLSTSLRVIPQPT
jgi:hypothetical protein